MATLVNGTVAAFREQMKRWIFLGQTPPWEEVTGGSPMSWPFTTFAASLHKTGDPGDAGDLTTNEADFTGYARQLLTRGATDFGILGSGSASPILQVKKKLTWPKNTGSLQAIHAVGLGARVSSVDHAILRSVLGSPVDVDTNERFNIPGGQARLSIDTALGGSSTTAAAFDTWEEAFAKYIAYGGNNYADSFPGLTTSADQTCYLALANADPRAGIVYPNHFSAVGVPNATYEPTQAEYEGYNAQPLDRVIGGGTGVDLEAVEDGSGVWKVVSKNDVTFPDADSGSAGGTWPYVVLLLAGMDANAGRYYASLVHELDTAFTVPPGGAGGLVIPAGDLEFEFR